MQIVDYALENVDMIVMGTHGRGTVARFFPGSVTENVIRPASHVLSLKLTTDPLILLIFVGMFFAYV